jgi:hypothetical protein
LYSELWWISYAAQSVSFSYITDALQRLPINLHSAGWPHRVSLALASWAFFAMMQF